MDPHIPRFGIEVFLGLEERVAVVFTQAELPASEEAQHHVGPFERLFGGGGGAHGAPGCVDGEDVGGGFEKGEVADDGVAPVSAVGDCGGY